MQIKHLTEQQVRVLSALDELLTPVLVPEPGIFPESVKKQVHLAVQNLREQNKDLQAVTLRVQANIEVRIHATERKVSSLAKAVRMIDDTYTNIVVDQIADVLDDIMSKEESLYQRHTASVAAGLDRLHTTLRGHLTQTTANTTTAAVTLVSFLSDILAMSQEMRENMNTRVLPALRYIADHMMTPAAMPNPPQSSDGLLNRLLALEALCARIANSFECMTPNAGDDLRYGRGRPRSHLGRRDTATCRYRLQVIILLIICHS